MQYTIDTALWGTYRTLNRTLSKIFSVRYISRLFLLTCCLSTIWYSMMLLMSWYSAGFHLAATLSSTVMVATGNSWGVVEKLVIEKNDSTSGQ